MKKKFLILIIALSGTCLACSDWLDVKPSDRVYEKNNFSTLAGFKQALNGVYIELNRSELYGRSLTCEFVEILAQRYAIADDNKANLEVMEFQYGGATSKSKISSIWSNMYTLIANVNLILKNCEEHREVLPDEYYHLIKGEALALRAYLHFDLFRLFGPAYSETGKEESIPYYKDFSLELAPSCTPPAFMKLVTGDLLEAEKELAGDPVIEKGVIGDKKDNFLSYRNLRLNYYAVQGVLARVYLYMGKKTEAAKHAANVIAVQESRFPWITAIKLSNPAKMDRVFSSEILFALQNLERNTLFTKLFDGHNLKTQSLLAPRADVTLQVFEDDKMDYRYKSSLASSVELSGTSYAVFNKYEGKDSLYNQMLPMVRVSEMYLIAAEAAGAENGFGPLNTLRNNRGLESADDHFDERLEREWIKEFFGEGQLFFYYKRRNFNEVQSPANVNNTVSIAPENYVLPIPDSESKYN